MVAQYVRDVADAAMVAVLLHDEATATLTIEAVEAAIPVDGLLGHSLPTADTAFEAVLTGGEAVLLDHVGKAAPWPVPLPALRAVVAPFAAPRVSSWWPTGVRPEARTSCY